MKPLIIREPSYSSLLPSSARTPFRFYIFLFPVNLSKVNWRDISVRDDVNSSSWNNPAVSFQSCITRWSQIMLHPSFIREAALFEEKEILISFKMFFCL